MVDNETLNYVRNLLKQISLMNERTAALTIDISFDINFDNEDSDVIYKATVGSERYNTDNLTDAIRYLEDRFEYFKKNNRYK